MAGVRAAGLRDRAVRGVPVKYIVQRYLRGLNAWLDQEEYWTNNRDNAKEMEYDDAFRLARERGGEVLEARP